ARRQVAVRGRVDQRAGPRLFRQAAGRPAFSTVDVEALVEPVAGEALAVAELDVDLVALRVAVLVEVGFAVLAIGAVVLLHGVGPAVRVGRPPTPGIIEGAAG